MSAVPRTEAAPDGVRLLEHRVALITGASRGIGASAAEAFARAGAHVVLAARDEAALERVAAAIRTAGGQALVVPTDVGDAAAVEHLIGRTVGELGRLDAAFNNAGGSGHLPTPLAEVNVDDFDATIQTNLRGVFLCMQHEIRAMLRTGGGAIVNVSSTAGLSGVRGLAAYAASKHGVIGLTKSAALDYAAQGIRVNAIAPGPIMNDRIRQVPEAHRAPIAAAVPMGRIGQPGEVAATAVWLCSDHASFITGATLSVDGGRMAGV
jgi:NAD(P)-dependent dehydrogenase (short-subunit alcohol dehydrogenase family)